MTGGSNQLFESFNPAMRETARFRVGERLIQMPHVADECGGELDDEWIELRLIEEHLSRRRGRASQMNRSFVGGLGVMSCNFETR